MDLARGWRPQLAHAAGAAMNSSRREDALLMSPGGYLATSGVLFIIGFVGCFANLLVIILFAKNKQVRSPFFQPLAFFITQWCIFCRLRADESVLLVHIKLNFTQKAHIPVVKTDI
jgi:hypothetical protein